MALSSKIQALINYANETTRAGDTTLGDAVKTLCDGYGGGGNEGYQEVEYLESNGSQFINLNFGFSPTDVIDTKFAVLSGTSDKYVVSPAIWNNSNNRFGLGVQNGAYTAAFGAMASGSCKLVPTTTYNSDLVTWHYENRLVQVKEKGLSFDTSAITFGSDTANLRLFYGYNANTSARLSHYFHYKSNGAKIELIPCYRRTDRKPGLYDLVSETFYTNDGLSDFVVGPETDEHHLPGEGGGGGGRGYYEGTFIQATNTRVTPLLTHNLGTTRILLTIELVADTRQAVTSYSPLFVSINTLIFDYKAKIDCSGYSQYKGEVDIDGSVGASGNNNGWGSILTTPYTNQTYDFYGFVLNNPRADVFKVFNENAIQVDVFKYFTPGLTYKYRIWKLD